MWLNWESLIGCELVKCHFKVRLGCRENIKIFSQRYFSILRPFQTHWKGLSTMEKKPTILLYLMSVTVKLWHQLNWWKKHQNLGMKIHLVFSQPLRQGKRHAMSFDKNALELLLWTLQEQIKRCWTLAKRDGYVFQVLLWHCREFVKKIRKIGEKIRYCNRVAMNRLQFLQCWITSNLSYFAVSKSLPKQKWSGLLALTSNGVL